MSRGLRVRVQDFQFFSRSGSNSGGFEQVIPKAGYSLGAVHTSHDIQSCFRTYRTTPNGLGLYLFAEVWKFEFGSTACGPCVSTAPHALVFNAYV